MYNTIFLHYGPRLAADLSTRDKSRDEYFDVDEEN